MASISRKFVVPALAAGALVLAGTAYGVTEYRNIPGPVTGSYASGISGTFHYEVAATGGIPSNGWGGACLIFRAKDLGFEQMEKKHCTQDSDCTTNESGGYCEQTTKKCWAKAVLPTPEDADGFSCLRRIEGLSPQPLQVGETLTIPVSHANLVNMKIPQTAKVRVLTCLNSPGGRGCAGDGTKYKHEWGDPTQLHP
jgi:hypothetical protein